MEGRIVVSGKKIGCFVNQYGECWLTQRGAELIQREVKQYMVDNVEDNVDWQTNEVNNTQLAEDAASHFNIYGFGGDCPIPTQVYDWAIEVGNDWEYDHQVD